MQALSEPPLRTTDRDAIAGEVSEDLVAQVSLFGSQYQTRASLRGDD